MAQRRMLSRAILEKDEILTLTDKAKALYPYLVVCADDDGFTENVTALLRLYCSDKDALNELVETGLLLDFGTGIFAVVHFHSMNLVEPNKYQPTVHRSELAQLANVTKLYGNKSRNRPANGNSWTFLETSQNVSSDLLEGSEQNSSDLLRSIVKGSIEQDSIEQDSVGKINPVQNKLVEGRKGEYEGKTKNSCPHCGGETSPIADGDWCIGSQCLVTNCKAKRQREAAAV